MLDGNGGEDSFGTEVKVVRWLMVDRIEECEPGKRAIAVKTFPRSDLLFLDHFPERPLVPGVLQIEMIAQTAAACMRILRPEISAVLSHVRSARFVRPVRPGDLCRITAEIVALRPAHVIARGTIEVDQQKTAEAEILAVILPGVHADPPRDPLIAEWLERQGSAAEMPGNVAAASRNGA